jgi:hypothetical protein
LFYAVLMTVAVVLAASPIPDSLEDALALLQPYAGEAVRGVDPTTLNLKVLCGYQGWFTAPGDGSERGWCT